MAEAVLTDDLIITSYCEKIVLIAEITLCKNSRIFLIELGKDNKS